MSAPPAMTRLLPDLSAAIAEALTQASWEDASWPVQQFAGEVTVKGMAASVADLARVFSRHYAVESPPDCDFGPTCRAYCVVEPVTTATVRDDDGQLRVRTTVQWREVTRMPLAGEVRT